MGKRVYHTPAGDPCVRRINGLQCGLPASRHRVDHKPEGDPCTRQVGPYLCGLPSERHYRKSGYKSYGEKTYFAGIDGEGQGREDHRYVMLAWADEDGSRKGALEAPEGGRLSTKQCLDFILSIPINARLFAFAFNYDLTKILTDVDDKTLYRLFRPELRQRKKKEDQKKGPVPEYWNGYQLNYMGSKFTVAKGGRRHIIWDVFRFFQTKFTNALEDWFSKEDKATGQRIWTPSDMGPVVTRMRHMKDQRADFDSLTRKEILAYCYDECAYMARLAHKLDDAHKTAGLHLKAYHGAGSTASCILKLMGIDKEVRSVHYVKHLKRVVAYKNAPQYVQDELRAAISAAFFGGRFENLVIGRIPGPIWGYDISSAYPYQTTFLPCLACGRWEKVTKREGLAGATTAVVNYGLGKPPRGIQWGPFPFRFQDGSICFPSTCGGGWVWLSEYLEGERLYPHVEFRQAWVYRTDCQHKPFAEIPSYYLERLRIGKEGPGIVIKLGVNAVYGKLAQSLGIDPPFQCWIWAGMITSGTRAQILRLIGLHKKPSNVLMIATDGIYSREKLETPLPTDTGTGIDYAIDETGKPVNKPLGGWERKIVESGMFAARPGIYFPLNLTEKELKNVRARGVGRGLMYANADKMIAAWEAGEAEVKIPNLSRFHGAKSSISIARDSANPGQFTYTRAPMLDDEGEPIIDSLTGKARQRYGQWTTKPVVMTFDPMPKREGMNRDGTLKIRALGPDMVSKPYEGKSVMTLRAVLEKLTSVDAYSLFVNQEAELEQPDGGDWADYEQEG